MTAVGRLAGRLGLSEGQMYTAVIGLVIGLATAAIGIPPTLRDRPLSARAPLSPRAAGAPTAGVFDEGDTTVPAQTAEAQAPPAFSGADAPAAPLQGRPSPRAAASPVAGTRTTSLPRAQPEEAASNASSSRFADGGKLGDVDALATVGSPGAPSGIAVDSDGGFYVGTDNGGALGEAGPSKVLRYSASGSAERSYTVTGQPQSHSRGVSAVVLDKDGRLVVLDASTARILRVERDSARQVEVATLPDLPACTLDQSAQCEPSPLNGKPLPQAAALLPNGNLLVADAGQGVLWSVDQAGATTVWDASMDYASTDAGPSGITVEPDGSVLLVISKSVTGFGGVLYRIAVGPDGAHGARTRLYGSDANSTPNGLTVGASGRIYMALTGSNSVVVLDKSGALVRTITSPKLSRPFGLAFRGTSLLVTSQAPATGSVLRLPVEDTAVRG